jgi:folylpolyglutamate synthase/dihydropteroate synthase
MAGAIAPVADAVFVSGWRSARAADPREIAAPFRSTDASVTVMADLPQAYEAAVAHAGERGAVVAFGAIAFVAQLREYLLGIESDRIMLASKS